MTMNEHIQELISAYLHRGSTPEQERELFDACRRDPEIAEQLRQHLILSLKLRGLRDDVTVSPSLHAAVAQRIAEASAPAASPDAEHEIAAAPAPPPRRFRLAHLFGTGVATAAAAAALVLLLLPETDPGSARSTQPVANLADTVYIVEKDTVTQLREVTRTVYIAAAENAAGGEKVRAVENAHPRAGTPVQDGGTDLAQRSDGPSPREDSAPRPANIADETAPDAARPADPVSPSGNPAGMEDRSFADARPVEPLSTRAQTKNYLEQYNAMLVAVASVQLTSADRIAH